jgi:hypothetical protein
MVRNAVSIPRIPKLSYLTQRKPLGRANLDLKTAQQFLTLWSVSGWVSGLPQAFGRRNKKILDNCCLRDQRMVVLVEVLEFMVSFVW